MKKVVFLCLCFFFGLGLYQCSKPEIECDCTSNFKPYFDIKGVNLEHLDYNRIPFKVADSSTILLSRYYGFKLKFDYILTAFNSSPTKYLATNSLLACECPPNGELGSKNEKIKGLNVSTVYDYDASHPAGSNINDYLLIGIPLYGEVLLNDFLALDTSTVKTTDYPFKLLKKPTLDINGTDKPFQLKVEVKLSDTEQYITYTPFLNFR